MDKKQLSFFEGMASAEAKVFANSRLRGVGGELFLGDPGIEQPEDIVGEILKKPEKFGEAVRVGASEAVIDSLSVVVQMFMNDTKSSNISIEDFDFARRVLRVVEWSEASDPRIHKKIAHILIDFDLIANDDKRLNLSIFIARSAAAVLNDFEYLGVWLAKFKNPYFDLFAFHRVIAFLSPVKFPELSNIQGVLRALVLHRYLGLVSEKLEQSRRVNLVWLLRSWEAIDSDSDVFSLVFQAIPNHLKEGFKNDIGVTALGQKWIAQNKFSEIGGVWRQYDALDDVDIPSHSSRVAALWRRHWSDDIQTLTTGIADGLKSSMDVQDHVPFGPGPKYQKLRYSNNKETDSSRKIFVRNIEKYHVGGGAFRAKGSRLSEGFNYLSEIYQDKVPVFGGKND
jgi:hypothetical protein